MEEKGSSRLLAKDGCARAGEDIVEDSSKLWRRASVMDGGGCDIAGGGGCHEGIGLRCVLLWGVVRWRGRRRWAWLLGDGAVSRGGDGSDCNWKTEEERFV